MIQSKNIQQRALKQREKCVGTFRWKKKIIMVTFERLWRSVIGFSFLDNKYPFLGLEFVCVLSLSLSFSPKQLTRISFFSFCYFYNLYYLLFTYKMKLQAASLITSQLTKSSLFFLFCRWDIKQLFRSLSKDESRMEKSEQISAIAQR